MVQQVQQPEHGGHEQDYAEHVQDGRHLPRAGARRYVVELIASPLRVPLDRNPDEICSSQSKRGSNQAQSSQGPAEVVGIPNLQHAELLLPISYSRTYASNDRCEDALGILSWTSEKNHSTHFGE